MWQRFTRAEKTFIVLFLFTLPFVQGRIRGDGIGYYAYVRSLLIDHNLEFSSDWKDPNTADFVLSRDERGRAVVSHYTASGHRADHFAVGPAMLWSPFLAATHLCVVGLDRAGWKIPADGCSRPYLLAMAGATAIYGFLGLWFSFQLAKAFFEERIALLATVGIWFATSLPAYMYVDTAWAHAHSVFASALFLWYWHRTSDARTAVQWVILGALAGLMLDVYYANFVFLLAPLVESALAARQAWQGQAYKFVALRRLLLLNALFVLAAVVAFLPTLITRTIIFGSPLGMGLYTQKHWNWDQPAFWGILFSPSRGLAIWAPILVPAIGGLLLLWRRNRRLSGIFLGVAVGYYLLIATYPWWDGVFSFGSRYFITLTPLYVMGLTAAIAELVRRWGDGEAAMRRAVVVTALLIVWNLGLLYQWSTALLPGAGPVHWDEVVYNQFRVVPAELLHSVEERFLARGEAAGKGVPR
jgi:hypothetical protein